MIYWIVAFLAYLLNSFLVIRYWDDWYTNHYVETPPLIICFAFGALLAMVWPVSLAIAAPYTIYKLTEK